MSAIELLLQPDTTGAQSQLQDDAAIEVGRLLRIERAARLVSDRFKARGRMYDALMELENALESEG